MLCPTHAYLFLFCTLIIQPKVVSDLDLLLVPFLLPSVSPKMNVLWFDFHDPRFYQYHRLVAFDFIPLTFWTRFLAQLVAFSSEVLGIWKNGIVGLLLPREVLIDLTVAARVNEDVILVQQFRELMVVSIGVRSAVRRPIATFSALLDMCQLLITVTNVHSSPVRYEVSSLSTSSL